MQTAPVDLAEIQSKLGKIIDPELGRPITDLKLIDRLEVKPEGTVEVDFHLTAPFCPPVFALKIAADIKAAVVSSAGVKSSKVTLRGHYLAEAVNKHVNKPAESSPQKPSV
ncbi:MAG TPA: iron-sulfur cluster assembly protein [Nitrososphaerales archaeon]|nr:iron-sulfur cluster assembly protein [Nitrososphaerales archaeon]